jgi:F0F1-type ATP synthase assembly protein I
LSGTAKATENQPPLTELEIVPSDNTPDKNFWVQFARYSQLAFVLPACTVAGWLIGAGLDRWLHTTWIYLLGLLLGIVAGFVELIRTVMSSESDR